MLLLVTPEATFTRMIPYLLLFATGIFAASDWLRSFARSAPQPGDGIAVRLFAPLFAVSIYGGYFGAGVGILILALLALAGWTGIHRMNAVKVLFTACINGVAVIPFAIAGKISWGIALIVAVGAALGGYYGAGYPASRAAHHSLVRHRSRRGHDGLLLRAHRMKACSGVRTQAKPRRRALTQQCAGSFSEWS